MPLLRIALGDEHWDITLGGFLNVEIMAIERATGMTAVEFEEALDKGSFIANTALVWILRRRREPGLKFDDVEFRVGDLSSQVVDDEADEGKDEASEEASDST